MLSLAVLLPALALALPSADLRSIFHAPAAPSDLSPDASLPSAPPTTSFCDAPGWALAWADEFSGDALNTTNWSVRNGTAENDSSCRDAMCLADNVAVRGGALVLTAKREARGWASYTTGAVDSQNKRFFAAREGAPFRLCVSGKLPGTPQDGAGLWPAFWLMPNTDACWPDNGELCVIARIDRCGRAATRNPEPRQRPDPVI